ncbi:hypothetical protein POVCU2_0061250 [Plasmodium ovale curtisi]|uniref:C2H2-type domain-containing protein n=1 Tax=Plasmodium ovale curtisi TaxID=864141 RepID=A0A1A8VY54_PLAOA|nr:hypothetical protein POVCU1_010470 [Plasmodium ovale curtisi]SBS90424.1 hypothetical protein POVCU2_0061250 [Plasmodium ovale curtisi]
MGFSCPKEFCSNPYFIPYNAYYRRNKQKLFLTFNNFLSCEKVQKKNALRKRAKNIIAGDAFSTHSQDEKSIKLHNHLPDKKELAVKSGEFPPTEGHELDREAAIELLDKAVDRTVDKAVDRTVDKTVDKAVDRTVDKAVDRTVDKTVDKTVDRTVDKTVDIQLSDSNAHPSTRTFLTGTKYYRRSKYSKAGFLKGRQKDENNFTATREDNPLASDMFNDLMGGSYVESREELIKDNLKKSVQASSMSIPELLIKNYYSDSNRQNDLDLVMKKKSTNEMISVEKKNTSDTYEQVEKAHLDSTQRNSTVSFMNEFTVIGEIVGIHGLHGWLKVVSFTTFNDIRFKKNSYRYLFMNTYPYPLPVKIIDVKESLKVGFLYVKLEKIISRTDGLKLKNCLLCDDKRNFPDLGENKYISTDLLNFDIYIFNDFTNTSIGKVFTFLSKYDYICSRSVQEISDDLIKIELNKNVPLQQVFNIMNASKLANTTNADNSNNVVGNSPEKNSGPIKLLMNRTNFNLRQWDRGGSNSFLAQNDANTNNHMVRNDEFSGSGGSDETERIRGDKNYYDSLDNFDGCSYKKIYKCDFCDDVYESVMEASEHENSHFQSDEELLHHSTLAQEATSKERLRQVMHTDLQGVKRKIDYFFIPIVKEKTIRAVHYELKKIYLDISTVFLLDDQK